MEQQGFKELSVPGPLLLSPARTVDWYLSPQKPMQTTAGVDDTPAQAFRSKVSAEGSQNDPPVAEEEDEDGRKTILQVLGENPNIISTVILVLFLILLSSYAAEAQGDKATFAMRDQIKTLYGGFEDVKSVDEWYDKHNLRFQSAQHSFNQLFF